LLALVIVGMGVLCGMNWPRSGRGWFDFTFGWGEWITLRASVLFTGHPLKVPIKTKVPCTGFHSPTRFFFG
jgi:hypothetical protein